MVLMYPSLEGRQISDRELVFFVIRVLFNYGKSNGLCQLLSIKGHPISCCFIYFLLKRTNDRLPPFSSVIYRASSGTSILAALDLRLPLSYKLLVTYWPIN